MIELITLKTKYKMVTIKTKHGEFKYKDWQWYLAWLLVFLCGVAVGIIDGL